MKLILTAEVDGLGNPGDIVEVKDGYGRNFLIPQGLALGWTRGAEKQIGVIKRVRDARSIRNVEHAEQVRAQLEALQVRVSARAAAEGRLFGSVTQADVAEAIAEAGGPAVDRRTVRIAQPIKTTGGHAVSVRLHDDVTATVRLEVVSG